LLNVAHIVNIKDQI